MHDLLIEHEVIDRKINLDLIVRFLFVKCEND